MPHKPLQTYDRKMKRFVTASESKAVTAEGISNNNQKVNHGMHEYATRDRELGGANGEDD